MPRLSAEARAATVARVGGQVPAPPQDFSEREQVLWRRIVRSKPLGWFDEGALPLLQRYCTLAAHSELLERELRQTPVDDRMSHEFERRLSLIASNLTVLATKLRLSVQNQVDRRSAMILEKGPQAVVETPTTSDHDPADDDGSVDNLIGGKAAWQRAA